MVDPTNDLTKQARSGSITAIIQLLNEDLAAIGVRARAMRENDLLQLLCEAETVEPLEQSTLVARIRQILESIGPKDIRRVKINCRLVREQQLLWLQEINREKDNHLLWFEEIKLARRNPFTGIVAELRERQNKSIKQPLPKPSPSPIVRNRRQVRRGMIAGVVMSLSLLLVGWGFYKWFGLKQADSIPVNAFVDASLQTSQSNATADPFAAAVRMAEQASAEGRTAQTPAQWLETATRWRKASDLMAQVSSDDQRFETAQNRIVLYRKNSEAALQKVERRRF